jgi:hypothetical protein
MDPDRDILRRFFESIHVRHDTRFGTVLVTKTFTIPFLPFHRINSDSLRSAVLALASYMQVDVCADETLHREITLCTEALAAIHDQDFVKVFYSCFVRFILFSMSERLQTDIDYECFGLWASFGEIREQRSVLAPGELFTMENCLYYAIPALVPNDIMSFSSHRSQMSQEDLWVPILPANETGGFGNLTSWYDQIEGTMANFSASLNKEKGRITAH